MSRSISLGCFCLLLGFATAAFSQDESSRSKASGPYKYHQGVASNPGKLSLSLPKLFRLDPTLAPPSSTQLAEDQPYGIASLLEAKRAKLVTAIKEHVECGDSRAATVVSIDPLLVAAYTDELDCVAMLRFPQWLVQEYKLKPGSRLLTINTYPPRGSANDLRRGPKELKRYGNFFPVIADFVTDEQDKVRQRKEEIPEEEWRRCAELAKEYRERLPSIVRDGAPSRSMIPAKTRE